MRHRSPVVDTYTIIGSLLAWVCLAKGNVLYMDGKARHVETGTKQGEMARASKQQSSACCRVSEGMS